MSRLAGRLTVSPSLNRTVVASYPGLPDEVAGRHANSWLTAWAVACRMQSRPDVMRAAGALGPPLPPLPSAADVAADRVAAAAPWPRRLDALVETGHTGAVGLADELGTVVGALVATLVLGPAEARAARPDWPVDRWEAWSRVRRLALGGGLLSGQLGRRMAVRAAEVASDWEVPTTLTLVDDPGRLVLRGVASLLPVGGVAVDAGGTTVKVARVESSGPAFLPSRPAPTGGSAADVVRALSDAVAAAGVVPAQVAVGIATYVDDAGQPYSGQLGPYAPLGDVALVPALQDGIRERTGTDVQVQVTHDGRAALLGARLDDPRTDAVIVLGTAIGHALDPVG